VTLRGVDHLQRPLQPRAALAPLRIAAFPFAIAVAWAVIQCLSITPDAWHHPLWSQAQEYLGPQLPTSISIDRIASVSHLLRLITYAGIFWLSYNFCHDAARARAVMMAVILVVLSYTIWGLFVYWSGNTTILWFQKWAYNSDLTGTFVNRNSFATFLGLGLLTAVAFLLDAVRKRVDFRESTRGIIKSIIEFTIVHGRWRTLACLTIATGLLLTHSRGGAIATLVGISAFLAAANFAPSLRARWHIVFGLALVIAVGGVLAISDNVTTKRFEETSFETEGRLPLAQRTIEAIHDWPLLGTGLGTFRDVFPLYRTEDMPLAVAQAHNDYLETIVELGWPIATCLFVSIGVLLGICIRGVRRRRRNAIFPCIGVGATTLVAFHSLFDFSLQIPGVTATYWLLMGAAVAQSFNSPQASE
jgi:O-Antigen ligase